MCADQNNSDANTSGAPASGNTSTQGADKKSSELSKDGKSCQWATKLSGWLAKNLLCLSLVVIFVVSVVVVLIAASDACKDLRNPALQNVATRSTITSNTLVSCCSASNGVLFSVTFGTNSVPVSLSAGFGTNAVPVCLMTTTTSTVAGTDRQWFALILLLVPVILSAIVAIVVLRQNDDY
jgi:hypothetical protein